MVPTSGFPKGVEDRGALQNLMGGGVLNLIHGGSMGTGLKCCQRIPVKEFICSFDGKVVGYKPASLQIY